MEEEKKLCTPQHSINGYVPLPTDYNTYDKAVCSCGRIMWVKILTCGCTWDSPNATFELQARPNQ